MRRSRRTAVRFVSALVLFTVTAGGIAVAGSFHISQVFRERRNYPAGPVKRHDGDPISRT